jgi:hypothetical protein
MFYTEHLNSHFNPEKHIKEAEKRERPLANQGSHSGSLQQIAYRLSRVGVGWLAWGVSRNIKNVVYAHKIWYHDCVTHCELPCFRLHLIIYQAFVVTPIRGGRDDQLFNNNLNEVPYGRGGNNREVLGDLEVQEDNEALEI